MARKKRQPRRREPVAEDYPIANPEDHGVGQLFVISFGAYADTKLYTWARSVERALEKAAEALTEDERRMLKYDPTDEEYNEIQEELGPDATPEEIEERWSADMTYVDALGGYIPSDEWWVNDVRDDQEIAEVEMRSRQEVKRIWPESEERPRRNPTRGRPRPAGEARSRPKRQIPPPPSSDRARAAGGPRRASRPGAGRSEPRGGQGRPRFPRPPARRSSPAGGPRRAPRPAGAGKGPRSRRAAPGRNPRQLGLAFPERGPGGASRPGSGRSRPQPGQGRRPAPASSRRPSRAALPPRRNPVKDGKGIKVKITEDRQGNLNMDPVNERLKRKYQNMIVRAHRASNPEMHKPERKAETEAWLRDGAVIFIQSDYGYDEMLEILNLRRSERDDIVKGWGVTKIVPLEEFERWFGHYNEIDMGY